MDNKEIFEWFVFADRDLTSAEFLTGMHPQPLEIICYHCQQSAEKYLKGFLIHNGIEEPPKIHNLVILCDMCMTFDERFAEIKKQCNSLTKFGVQPRYPNEFHIEEHHMTGALEHARQIKDFSPLVEVRKELES